MSYKIVRVTNLYGEYLKQYYAAHSDLSNKEYIDQYNHLINDSFDIVSSISKGFKDLGVEAHNIFTNATQLQNKWKEENNCIKSDKELIIEQIKSLLPDIVWLDDIALIDKDWISFLKENVPTIRIVTGHICAPYSSEDLKNFRALNFLFTCTPCLRNEFEKMGVKSYLIYHSFEKSLLGRIEQNNSYDDIDLLFTGSLYTGGGFHKTRIEYLEKMLDYKLPLKIYGAKDNSIKILTKILAFYGINLFRKMGFSNYTKSIPILGRYESYGNTPVRFYSKKLRSALLQPVYGLEQFKLLSKAKICFNIHGEIAGSCAGNLRLFEATGAGACLVTDWKENITELFDPDREIVTYKSVAECVEKVKWLLANPSERIEIAQRGQSRTLKDHTVQNRLGLINGILNEQLNCARF